MNIDDEKYYENKLEMFNTQGWKDFISERESELEHLQKTAHHECVDNDTWQVNRGLIIQLEKLVNYESMVRIQLENIEIESKMDALQESFH